MSSISAGTTLTSALVATGDTSGNLELKSGGVTKLTVSSSGVSIPTLVGANIDLASNVTGTLPVANGGTGVTSAGAAGNVLISNGTSWTSAAPAASGGVYTFTASGSITAGDPVVLNSDGTVSIAGVNPAVLGDGALITNVGSNSRAFGYSTPNNKYLYAYKDNVANRLYLVVGTPSDLTITLGDPLQLYASGGAIWGMSYDPNQDVFYVAWSDSNNYFWVSSAAISGTSVTNGGNRQVTSVSTSYIFIRYCSTNQCHAISYITGGNLFVGTAAKTGNSTPTLSSPYQSPDPSAFAQGGSFAYDPVSQRCRMFVRRGQVGENSFYIQAQVDGTGTGASISAIYTSVAGTYQLYDRACYYDSVSGSFLQVFYDSSASIPKAQVFTTGGSTGTIYNFPTGYIPNTSTSSGPPGYVINGQFYIYAYDTTNSYSYLMPCTITGTDVSFGTPVAFTDATWYGELVPATYPDFGFYYLINGTNEYYGAVYRLPESTISRFVGLSSQTVADEESVDVNIVSGVNEEQTSLTTGSTYYLDAAGDLTTSSSTGVKVGRALSATSILVTGGQG